MTGRTRTKRDVTEPVTIDHNPMPSGTIGELVNEAGGHVGWIVKSVGPVVPLAEVRNGLLMFSAKAREVISGYEGKRVVVLRVED